MKKGDYQTLDQARNYEEKRFSRGLKMIAYDEADILNQFIKATNKKDATYIDLGSGTGRAITEILKHNPNKIYALDASNAMLNLLAEKFAKQKKGKITLIHAKSDKIPLSEKVDIVTSLHLFKHLEDITPTIKEVGRILKPQGYLIFDMLNKNSVINFAAGDCNTLDIKEVRKTLNENGFKINNIVFLHLFGETIYNFLGGIIHPFDALSSRLNLQRGTKMFILAQKNE